MPRMYAMVCVLSVGCGFDPSPVSSSDAGRPDGAAAGPDAALADGGPIGDATEFVLDTADPPDTPEPLPDAAIDAAQASCQTIYGAATEFVSCTESASECSFSVQLDPDCKTACEAFGGTCVGAYDNPNSVGNECTRGSTLTCTDSSHATNLCVCSHP